MSFIMFKFRSSKAFEELPLAGTSIRLFNVKRAIVKKKKLHGDFDLRIQNATTGEEYNDETMLLPRGTRLVVQRLPAPERGQGLLARMARADAGIARRPSFAQAARQPQRATPNEFYTIQSRNDNDEEEFDICKDHGISVRMAATKRASPTPQVQPAKRPRIASTYHDPNRHTPTRRAAKRPKGIPSAFLCQQQDDTMILKTKTRALGEIVHYRGGHSSCHHDLDYALQLTATSIPEHLQCSICHSVVNGAMMLPWDPQGRTACELCIRNALAQNGFECPITGMKGVSPDDLLPNVGLGKAADLFVKEIINQIKEIETQQEEEDPTTEEVQSTNSKDVNASEKVKDESNCKLFEEEDVFGGDVFDVAPGCG